MEEKSNFGILFLFEFACSASNSLNERIGSSRGDAAHVALVPGHLDVAVVTPLGSPRVLDQPVVLTVFSSVADDKNAVIETIGSAVGLAVDSLGVELEGFLGSIDGNGHRAHGGDSLHQSLFVSGRNVDESDINCSDVLLAEVALLLIGVVGVRGFSVDAVVVLDVLEGKVHEASLASMVAILHGAVDQVLFAERNELAGLAEVLTLQSAGGRESPARSTLTLVLHFGDGSLGPPVDDYRNTEVFRGDEGCSDRGVGALEEPLAIAVLGADDLVIQLVSEVVHLHGEGGAAEVSPLVVSSDPGLVVHEDLHPDLVFHWRGVVLVFVELPSFPFFPDDFVVRQ